MPSTSANKSAARARIALLIGGVAVACAAVTALRPGGGGGQDGRPLDARRLGVHLLTAARPDEVRAGMEALTKAAERGDVEAEVALGRIYLQGLPAVARDAAAARGWLMRAEAAHHPGAAYYLGVMSQRGQGAAADPAEAARWFEIAAREGSPQAMFLLANAYRAGAGVPRDEARALSLYAKAGEMEHPAALQALSLAYLHGELGLEPDEAEARRYAMEAEHAVKHAAASSYDPAAP